MPRQPIERSGPRPGGRSARVQRAVHKAVRELQASANAEELTVPAIAVRAGVTPSTIYRRWGTLPQLLSDVAVENLRPEAPPADTGSLEGDLKLWLEQYIDEMSSAPGRAMLRDVLSAGIPGNAGQCSVFTREQIENIRIRALSRGEIPPASETVLDQVVAPLMYRILFTSTPPTTEEALRFVVRVLSRPGKA